MGAPILDPVLHARILSTLPQGTREETPRMRSPQTYVSLPRRELSSTGQLGTLLPHLGRIPHSTPGCLLQFHNVVQTVFCVRLIPLGPRWKV